MSKFYQTNETVVAEPPHSILIMGPMATRKTTTAATASEHFPTNLLKPGAALPPWPATVAPTQLSDLLYLCWDKDALLGFPRLGLSVPHLKLDLIKPRELLPSKANPDAALPDIHSDVDKRVRSGDVKVIVHDTQGSLDHKILALCTELFDKDVETDPAKKNASQVLYRNMLKVHLQEFQFYTSLKRPDGTPVTNVFLFHTTVKGDSPTTDPKQLAAAQTQNIARGLGETGGKITARITGQAWEFYMNSCGLTVLSAVKGPEGQQQAVLYTKGGLNSLTRDRGGVLNAEEPANLRALLAKYTPAAASKQ